MKVCTFAIETIIGEQKRLGVFIDELQIIDINRCWEIFFQKSGFYNCNERANSHAPSSLHSILTLKEKPIEFLLETVAVAEKLKASGATGFIFKSDTVSLRAPMDKISTYRDFYAHEKHVAKGFKKRKEEIPQAWYEIPAYYKGATVGFIGPEQEVLWPSYTKILDYELELGAIVSKDGKNIKEENAIEHIFGFTILNDISARDIQKKEMAVRLGPAKGKDFCSVIGPVITTIDEFNNKEPDLTMVARINGEEWSRGQSGDSRYSFSQMISHVAKDEWVLAGDLMGSGTVGTGCGLEIDRWIQPDDVIELEIESIGILKNTIGKPEKG